MTDFLIKSTIALSAFLVFYHLILEKEKMHHFNRFYLLFSIVFSLLIPFISFEIIKEVPVDLSNKISFDQMPIAVERAAEETNYKLIFLWGLYGFVTLLLAIRFTKNIWKMLSKSSIHPTINFKNAKLVLLAEKTIPHTFLNYIFVNSDDHYNRNIEEELYMHELVHVTQKHTFDILFVEFIKIIFWFNPVFLFYKKTIQLNHEFLADQEIVEKYNNVPFYQNLLLKSGNGNQTVYLASNLNYLVTKKRLIMMKKTTSKNIAFLKKMAIVPVIGVLAAFLCVKTIAQETKMSTNRDTIKNVSDVEKFYSKTTVVFKDPKKNIILKKKYNELTDQQKKMIPPPPPAPVKKSPELNEYAAFKNSSKYVIWIDDVSVPNTELDKYEAGDFVFYDNSVAHKNGISKKLSQKHQVILFTKAGFSKKFETKPEFAPETITFTTSSSLNNKADLAKKGVSFKVTDNSTAVKNEPQFPGGIEEFYKFIGKNFKTPEDITKNKIKTKVYTQFMIEKDGSLSEFKIIKDPGYGLGDEAIRVLKLSPNWIPGTENGNPVRVLYSLPILVQSKE